MSDFSKGDVYGLDELPESDMTNSGNLEMVGGGVLAGKFGDEYVTFEWVGVRVTDVTPVDEL